MIRRTKHTHGRVGYVNGPQVPHPATPEYGEELARFEGWWEQIWAHCAKQASRTSR